MALACAVFDPFSCHPLRCSTRSTAVLWNVLNGKVLKTFMSDAAVAEGGFCAVSLSTSGLVVTAAGRLVQVWDGQQGTEQGSFYADTPVPVGADVPTSRLGDTERFTFVAGHGHVTTLALPQLAKDRAKQRGISMFGAIGGVRL